MASVDQTDHEEQHFFANTFRVNFYAEAEHFF